MQVKVDNFELGYYFILAEEIFSDKVYEMRNIYEKYEDSGILEDLPEDEKNPFFGPFEP